EEALWIFCNNFLHQEWGAIIIRCFIHHHPSFGLISYPKKPKHIHRIHKLSPIFEKTQKQNQSKRLPAGKSLN
ncbi:hypothetical protein, partial [Vibrio harveyi]|uniref:hypothetical protein n=1 Tax=Vibrio harveyi TaxID=669 RepID=UPI001C6A13A1